MTNNARMAWMLHRYILFELLRVFLLSAAVLVTVIAFGAAIKPLASDELVGPMQTAKYIALASVPMLQFALPFAAGFAATLVLHRLTTDNEIQAMAAGGLSYSRILLPVIALGAVLVVVMVMLTQWMMPRVWALMERSIVADVTRMLRASIDKGVPFELGNLQIYADHLYEEDPPDELGAAETRLILVHVVAAELDDDGRITAEVSARQAVVDFYRHENRSYIKLALLDTVVFDGQNLLQTPEVRPTSAYPLPSAIRDHPMFMTRGDMLRLRENPDDFWAVARARANLVRLLRSVETRGFLSRHLNDDARVTLAEGDARVTVYADKLSGRRLSTHDDRPIEVEIQKPGVSIRQVRASSATLTEHASSTLAEPTFDLELVDCEVVDSSGQVINRRAQLVMPGLRPQSSGVRDLAALSSEELLEAAQGRGGSIGKRAERLQQEISDLRLQIQSRLTRRYALSATAMLLLLLGSTLAMVLRNALPLVIYLWAFIPSIVDIMLISGGGHMIKDGYMLTGMIVLWSGNALLAATTFVSYRRLARN